MSALFFTLNSYATDGSGGEVAGQSPYVMIILLVAMVAVFYFLMIRPQKKREKQAREMRSAIKVGDEIVTIGGVCGKVVNVKDDSVTIVSSESKLEFLKTSIASVTSPEDQLGQ